jgi:hypothetical protein
VPLIASLLFSILTPGFISPSAESRGPNFYTAVATADPSLKKRIRSITTSYSIGAPDVQARPYSLYQDMKNRGESPRFVVNLDGSERNLHNLSAILFLLNLCPNRTSEISGKFPRKH